MVGLQADPKDTSRAVPPPMSNEVADMLGMPRAGETQVGLHNRMTKDFNETHKIIPGDTVVPVQSDTATKARKKQGPGFWQATVE